MKTGVACCPVTWLEQKADPKKSPHQDRSGRGTVLPCGLTQTQVHWALVSLLKWRLVAHLNRIAWTIESVWILQVISGQISAQRGVGHYPRECPREVPGWGSCERSRRSCHRGRARVIRTNFSLASLHVHLGDERDKLCLFRGYRMEAVKKVCFIFPRVPFRLLFKWRTHNIFWSCNHLCHFFPTLENFQYKVHILL